MKALLILFSSVGEPGFEFVGVDAGPVEVLEGFEGPAEVGALGGEVGGDVGGPPREGALARGGDRGAGACPLVRGADRAHIPACACRGRSARPRRPRLPLAHEPRDDGLHDLDRR